MAEEVINPEVSPETTSPVYKSGIEDIDQDELSSYILTTLRNDIRDREEWNWNEKREYDINAYEGRKKPVNFPWKNASNFPVPLTPTLVDTAHANTLASIFDDPESIVEVKGVGKEDVKNAPILSDVLNWQLGNQIKTFDVLDTVISRAYKHGTGIVKVIQDIREKSVVLEDIPVEDIFVPLEARGFQVNQKCDHVFQMIAWTQGDLEERKAAKAYDGLDDLQKGYRVQQSSAAEAITQTRDNAAGTSLSSKHRRDMYFILECYLTYWCRPKGSDEKTPKEPKELVVWIGTNGGKILKVAENVLVDENGYGVRPFAAFRPYPYEDRFYGKSLPEKIRPIQEELDYAHNQNINAADIAISPPTFYNPAGDFDVELTQLCPGSCIPTSMPKDVFVAQRSVDPIFERQEDRYWDLAERLTGLTELFQGQEPSRTTTLGESVLRNNRSEIRFSTLYKRIEAGFKEMLGLIYFYDKNFLPEDTQIKVTGTADIQTVKQLFPKGIHGKYDFSFSSDPLTEKEQRKRSDLDFYDRAVLNPIVNTNEGNLYKMFTVLGEATNHKNIDLYVTKPSAAYVFSPEETIQRIMAGELDVTPDTGIDAERYVFKIQQFMKTDTYTMADKEVQIALALLLRRTENIRRGQLMAKLLRNKVASQGAQPMDMNGDKPMPQGAQA